ncbi:DotH/IcmK family type IV secretion protein [Massilia sp. NR 4-1]|uniref:DotH/IcmK family type IV secretion protein n=1 Tax=Massilia sp. NR 4-1 TaxID=1678028 RepID=UPI00067A830B|nr:DotH/IcmK family type IV secretion protein [Massilia sp. NR 4-1]AKU21205.1 conjugal transfer protein TraN [Massilia sp. NR 4-1]
MNKLPVCISLAIISTFTGAQAPQPGSNPANGTSAPPAIRQPSNSSTPQWVRARDDFPAPPTSAPSQALAMGEAPAPTQNTAYGPAAKAPPQPSATPPDQNGVAPLPPLVPPSGGQLDFNTAKAAIAPFTPDEIIKLRRTLDDTRKAKAYRPVRTVPRISSITVDLSPGAALPIARMLPGEMATLVFTDMAGNAWPLAAAPRVSDARSFEVEWLQDTASVVISSRSSYEDGNLVVMLRSHATPVMVKLVTGEPDSVGKNRIVDYRLDLRIPGHAPGAPRPINGTEKIALNDDAMQGFLDGIPPKNAIAIALHGDVPSRTQVWQFAGALYLRTRANIRSAFDQTMASSDGTRVYRLPPTPYIALSDGDRSVIVELDIN